MLTAPPAPRGYPIKLVRDHTPEIINATGEPGDLFYGPVAGDVTPWLRKKLGEEVLEYLVDGGVDELAQVLGVVEALAQEIHGVALENLVDLVRADPRGGFASGVMMYGRHDEFDGRDGERDAA